MNIFIKWLIIPLFLSIIACACPTLSAEEFLISEETLRENRFNKDTLYVLFEEEYIRKKEFAREQPKLKLDSISGIIYSLKRDGEYLFWEHSKTYLKLGEEGFYLVHADSIKSVEVSQISSNRIISPSLLMRMKERELFRNLVHKKIFILEKEGRCRYRKVPVSFGSGFIYAEDYE